MSHSRKKLDLTGQRFGKLTVLEPAENIGSRTAWRCRCSCGRETVVRTLHLRNGHVTSCGCSGNGPPHLRGRHLRGDDPHPDGAQQQHQRRARRGLVGVQAAVEGGHLLQGEALLSGQLRTV